jgi:hypothetical protein
MTAEELAAILGGRAIGRHNNSLLKASGDGFVKWSNQVGPPN